MPTKIKFDIYNEKNFKIYSREKIIHRDTDSIGLIKCLEYCRIDVSLSSSDDKAYIEIEQIGQDLDDGNIIISNFQTKTICTYAVCKNVLVPGYYYYTLHLRNKRLKGIYFIEPSSVRWERLVDLRNYLNSYISGLAFNMYRQRRENKFENDSLLPPNISNIYLYLQSNRALILNTVRSIVKNPICDLKKEYRESKHLGQLDMKSQKWLATKGLSKNTNIYMPQVVYSKHSIAHVNILENKWVKKVTTGLVFWLFIIENAFDKMSKDLRDRLREREGRRQELIREKNLLVGIRNVSSNRQNQIDKGIKYANTDIRDTINKLDLVRSRLLDVQKFKALLVDFNNKTWIKNVDGEERVIKPSIRLLKDPRYNVLYNTYFELENLNREESQFKDIKFAYKDTPTLFEYYSVLMVIGVLMDIGLVWQKGWLADEMGLATYNGEIPKGEPFIFISNDKSRRIELFYEKEILSEDEVIRKNISDFSRGLSNHYKPDILVAIFDNFTDQYITSIIVEAKCYRSHNLLTHEKNIPSRVIEQVRSYHGLGYYDVSRQRKDRFIRDAISKVIVTYPRQKKEVQYPYDGRDINFIQIEANGKNIFEHSGFKELKAQIEEVLNNN